MYGEVSQRRGYNLPRAFFRLDKHVGMVERLHPHFLHIISHAW